ncbi:hypothetical protein BN7_3419 [Wickerhamomyces ciferrii]|uniref:Chromatin modification-related protein n=1 Tax=Wickerhamomyces ciferrii (strain ATCC 14091 / BCRC 22168 / CBS 111 / JCM 3599 / NBRC 0793 / NRRL Y-1031 F-60-10) TaxID=1206466 RepID=K0KFG4_WICCF|nr:uncharacterized protein BN7_3419 [Wickerhamomyces ciferrii]CCH43865.1 hypothetical protein BN7_3419 [Wickerhamomyces ciferrii]
MSEYNLRAKTLRSTRNRHTTSFRPTPKASEIFPGLNDITDAFEALPTDVIRYFTLLKEIDAKCVNIIPTLNHEIKNFVKAKNDPNDKEARTAKIQEISSLLRDVLPCLEEKMHVATIAADKTISYIDRINDDFDLIFKNEIPENIKFGSANHPAIINDSRIPDNKSAQSQRSESRREALAARKAANDTDNDDSGTNRGKSRRAEKESTPVGSQPPAATTTKKRKTNNTTANNNASNTNTQNQGANNQTQGANTVKNEEPQISRPSTPSTNKRRQTTKKKPSQTAANQLSSQSAETARNVASAEAEYADEIASRRNNADEPLYCYCNQVSYGEMVGCDGDDCKREWFHLPCTGLATLPKGKWYCDDCNAKLKKAKKI